MYELRSAKRGIQEQMYHYREYAVRLIQSFSRFLNGSAAKALFRAGQIQRAERMAWNFIQAADPAQTLHDMQCMWYAIECGSAHLQAQDYGRVSISKPKTFPSWIHTAFCQSNPVQLFMLLLFACLGRLCSYDISFLQSSWPISHLVSQIATSNVMTFP